MGRLHQILSPRDREYFDLFEEAGANLERAADLLDQMLRAFPESRELARDILICEQQGDRITHDVIHSLFEPRIDPIVVIRWKDIFERLEQAIDACEHVANLLAGIVIKNS